MDKKLLNKIDQMIEECETELVNDAVTFININSEMGEPMPNAPFGLGPRKMLDAFMDMAKEQGFSVKDYNVGVVGASFKQEQPDLGIWIHGDVVNAGEGWSFPPYNATIYKNCIIGRGATDNKGQLSAIFNLFKIFKKLGVELKYNPSLYVGSNEENGMGDLKGVEGNDDAKGFINVCTQPKLSLIPDSSFPMGYGARGLCRFYIKAKTPLSFKLTAGLDDNPGLATAIFDKEFDVDELKGCKIEKGEKTVVSSYTLPSHTSKANEDGNMITVICSALIESKKLSSEEEKILKFFKDVSLDVSGEMLNIKVISDFMGKTVVFPKAITEKNGCAELEIRVRYPIEITYQELCEKISEVCNKNGFDFRADSPHNPYVNDKDSEVVKALTRVANEITGREDLPYVNGATYAHYLKNAYIFGMEGCDPPLDFMKGKGGAHGVDESVSIARLKRAMRIYARALLTLNEIEW
jgi:succinyl-diaminopimelate desuccinylase